MPLMSRAAQIAMISFRAGSCSQSNQLCISPPESSIQTGSQTTFHSPIHIPPTPKCSAHPSSRARAPSLLPATSPPPLCAWLRVLPDPLLPGRPALLEGQTTPKHTIKTYKNPRADQPTATPSPSARPPPRSSTSARKRRPSTPAPPQFRTQHRTQPARPKHS